MASCIIDNLWLYIAALIVPSVSPLSPPNPHTPTHSHTERGEVFSKQSLKFPDVHKSTEKTRGKQKRRDRTRTKSGSGQKQVGEHWQLGWERHAIVFFPLQETVQCLLLREFLSLLQSLKCKHPPPPLKKIVTHSTRHALHCDDRDDYLMHALVLKQRQLLLLLLRNVVTVYS